MAWKSELQFLWDITRGQRQTTACKIDGFPSVPQTILNIKETVCLCLYCDFSVYSPHLHLYQEYLYKI